MIYQLLQKHSSEQLLKLYMTYEGPEYERSRMLLALGLSMDHDVPAIAETIETAIEEYTDEKFVHKLVPVRSLIAYKKSRNLDVRLHSDAIGKIYNQESEDIERMVQSSEKVAQNQTSDN